MIYKVCKCECGKQFRDTSGKGMCKCGKQAQAGDMWYVKYIDSTGHPREKAVSSRLKDAQAFKVSVTHKRNVGECTEMEPVIMLHKAIDDWYAQHTLTNVNTQRTYGSAVKRVKAATEDCDMATLDVGAVRLSDNPGTRNMDITVLKMTYKYTLAKHEDTREMPRLSRKCRAICNMKMGKVNIKDTVLEIEDEIRLIANTLGADRMIITVALLTGLRINNVIDLKWSAIDLNVGTITMAADNIKDKEKLVLPIHPELLEKLKQWRKVQPISGRVFDGINYPAFRQRFRKICNTLGISDKVTPHTMRHTFATRLVEAGIDIGTVADLLGHSDSNFTRKVYVKTGTDHKLNAVSKLSVQGI